MAVALASVLQPLDNPRTPSHGDLAHPSARRGKAKTRLRSSSSRSWPWRSLSRARAPGNKSSLPEPKQPPKMLLTAARPPGMYDKQYHASAHDWTTRKTIVSPKLL